MATQTTKTLTQEQKNARNERARQRRAAKKAGQTAPKVAIEPTTREEKADPWAATMHTPYAAVFEAIAGKTFGSDVYRFYASGINYHISKGTSFPRKYALAHPDVLLSPDEAAQFLAKGAPASGSKVSQTLFDRLILAVGGLAKAKKLLSLA